MSEKGPETVWQTALAGVPQTPEAITAASAARGVPVPAACADGVAANLALLARHARTMRGEGA